MFTPGGVGMPEKNERKEYIKAAIRLGAETDHIYRSCTISR